MNIALIGSGGREHSICEKLLESNKIKKVFCIPGNAGTAMKAKNLNLDISNFKLLFNAIKKNKINLVIVGPEQPLVKGLVNFLNKKKIKVFGPDKYASQLEGSKAFMKSLCKKKNIPTAKFKICTKKNDVIEFLKKSRMPIVVKADGLAAGKGVTICKSYLDTIKVSNEIFAGKYKSSRKLVLEEFLKGEEASLFLIVDKKSFIFFGSAQDHKRVGENETGPNTGGMGAYSPASIINKDIKKKIIEKIVRPTLVELKKRGNPFTGFLYVGLMIKDNEPYLIEYNVRMGDPECQVILPRLKNDLVDVINAAIKNKLSGIKIKWSKLKCMTTVVCAKGYPKKHLKNKEIKNLNTIQENEKLKIFHAGTYKKDNKIISSGGRVLNITSLGVSFLKIRKNIHKTIRKINWKHGFFRKDIGWKVI
jgi:phosphoribosylamine--glycine ligase